MHHRHDHRLGLRGQFSIPPHLQEIAASYGLKIENMGGGKYRFIAQGEDTTRNLFPSFAQGEETFNAARARDILEFLRQPVGVATKNHEQRVLAHRIFRFITTGSAQVPGDINAPRHKYLEGDEHVEVETTMRTDDSWRSANEIGGDSSLPGAIPNSAYDPAHGLFSFKLHAPENESAAQAGLRACFEQCLSAAKIAPLSSGADTLSLTGVELENLCGAISDNAALIEPLAARAEFDEQVKTALANIEFRAQKNSVDEAVSNPVSFKNLLQATSSLTPILHSEVLHDAWTRHHFTARDNNPVAGLMMEAGILRAALDHYAERGGASESEATAITEEFQPFFAFTRSALAMLQEATQKSGYETSPGFRDAASIAENFPASLENQQYEEMILCLRKSAGLVGPVRSVGGAAVGATKGFVSDMYNFMRESPPLACAALALAGSLYWTMHNGGDSSAMMEYVRQIPDQSILLPSLSGDGGGAVPFDLHALPAEARHRQSWHYDANMVRWILGLVKGDFGNPVGLFKHFMFDIYITGPAHAVLNGVQDSAQRLNMHAHMPFDAANHFIKAADETIQPVADKLFGFNIFQNLTHAGFWMYMFGKGWRHGLAGGKMLAKLMAPIGDLACAGGSKVLRGAANLLPKRLVELRTKLAEAGQDAVLPKKAWLAATGARVLNAAAKAREQVPLSERLVALTGASPVMPSVVPENISACDSTQPARTISMRKAWLPAVGGACAATVAVSAGMDITGHHYAFTDAVATFSGRGLGGGLTASAFAVYNFFDDILLNHVGGGGLLLAQGAALRFIYQKAARPLSRTIRETAISLTTGRGATSTLEHNRLEHNRIATPERPTAE